MTRFGAVVLAMVVLVSVVAALETEAAPKTGKGKSQSLIHELEDDRELAHLQMDLEAGLADVKYVQDMAHNTEDKLSSALKDVQSLLKAKEVAQAVKIGADESAQDEPAPAAQGDSEQAAQDDVAPVASHEDAQGEPVDAAQDEAKDVAAADDGAMSAETDQHDDAPEEDVVKEESVETEQAGSSDQATADSSDAPDAAVESSADTPADSSADTPADSSADAPADSSAEANEPLDAALDGEEDLEMVALLQQDDMNDDMGEEEMIMAPRARPLRMLQQVVKEKLPPTADDINRHDKPFGPFAINSAGGTSDVTPDGQIIPNQPFRGDDIEDGVDVTGSKKVDGGDDSDSTLPAAKTLLPVPGGTTPTAPSANNTDANDAVCMCKRQGAPHPMKGHDRVKCKKHPKPSPTPEPPVTGIRQCVKGTWPGVTGATPDANTTDTICIYFPARLPTPPEVTQPEREFPDECYDDRNEFVAEGVGKRPWDQFLLQEGYEAHHFETCGCDA